MFVCLNCACVFSLMQGLMMYGKDITWSGPGLTCHKGFETGQMHTNATCWIRDLAICWHPYMVQMQPGELPVRLARLGGQSADGQLQRRRVEESLSPSGTPVAPRRPRRCFGPAAVISGSDQLVSWEQDNETSRWSSMNADSKLLIQKYNKHKISYSYNW